MALIIPDMFDYGALTDFMAVIVEDFNDIKQGDEEWSTQTGV